MAFTVLEQERKNKSKDEFATNMIYTLTLTRRKMSHKSSPFLSREEEAELARSNKKAKDVHHASFD